MTDETKPAVPAPSPAPAAPAAAARTVENPMLAWMRGGTPSSAYDQEQAKLKAAAEKSRAVEDERRRLAESGTGEAKQFKKVIGGNKEFAGIVLEVRHPKDNVVLDYIECELIVAEDGTLSLNMACYKCALRGVTDLSTGAAARSAVKFSQKHKRFDLDQRRAGELWVNPHNPQHVVTLAGTIHLHEVVTCPNLGCGMRFVIDNSVVREK